MTYRASDGSLRQGDVVPNVQSPDSGLFYFDFGSSNWEFIVKAADLCSNPGNPIFTILAGAATDREYALTVTDTISGQTKQFTNQAGQKPKLFRDAFATCAARATSDSNAVSSFEQIDVATLEEAEPSQLEVTQVQPPSLSKSLALASGKAGSCSPSSNRLCLLDGRFSVSIQYRDPNGVLRAGQVVPNVQSTDSGMFFFDFGPNNWEFLVKAADLCTNPGNPIFTLLAAAATDREYVLTVQETTNGDTREFRNPAGAKPELIRIGFATCDPSRPPATAEEALRQVIVNSPYRAIGDIRAGSFASRARTNHQPRSFAPKRIRKPARPKLEPGEEFLCDLGGTQVVEACEVFTFENTTFSQTTFQNDACASEGTEGFAVQEVSGTEIYTVPDSTACESSETLRDRPFFIDRDLAFAFYDEVDDLVRYQEEVLSFSQVFYNYCNSIPADADVEDQNGSLYFVYSPNTPSEVTIQESRSGVAFSEVFADDCSARSVTYLRGQIRSQNSATGEDYTTDYSGLAYAETGGTFEGEPRIAIAGGLIAGCSGTLYTFETLSPPAFDPDTGCPKSGEIRLLSNGVSLGRARFDDRGSVHLVSESGQSLGRFQSCSDQELLLNSCG